MIFEEIDPKELEILVEKLGKEKLTQDEYEKCLNMDFGVKEELFVRMINSEFCDFSVSVFRYNMLIYACMKGYTMSISFLITKIDPAMFSDEAIRQACMSGKADIVKILLGDERVDPSARRNDAIRRAAEGGFVEIVKLLLAHKSVDASANNNMALFFARKKKRKEIVKLLLEDEKVKALEDERIKNQKEEEEEEEETSEDESEGETEEEGEGDPVKKSNCCVIL